MAILKVRDANGKVSEIPAIKGKSAYEYAQDGGYTGTEEEFAEKLANGTGGGLVGTELTQAEYDALPEEEKNNGLYFITDGVYDEDMGVNPNELANGGFWLWSKGDSVTIVQGTNTSDIRTTDGWLAQYMMVSKGDGCAILEDKDTSQTKWFMQLFPFTLPQDDYTITIKVKSLNGTMAVKFEGDSSAEYRDLSVGVNVFTKNVAPQGVVLKGSPTKMEIEYIKLEIGTKSTPIKKRELLEEYYFASVCKKTNL